jgi:hypothetical protein
MKWWTRYRTARVAALTVAIAAIGAPAAQAALPDQGRGASMGDPVTPGLANKVRHEPQPPTGVSFETDSVLSVPGGFDWADAAVGAGIALGATALLGGALVVVRRSGQRNRLATR